jgi:hypothetical protein
VILFCLVEKGKFVKHALCDSCVVWKGKNGDARGLFWKN